MKYILAFIVCLTGLLSTSSFANDSVLKQAYESHKSNIQVQGWGTVIRLLPDDNDGSRHQKFILKLKNQQTLLIAHNIDLAPKVLNLSVGDNVEFYGEYEWNSKGGIIHWTHRDPQGHHTNGWLKHAGLVYQ
jgi:hypothetical protein